MPVMAATAHFALLTDQLIATVANTDQKETPRFKNLKRRAEETIKAGQHGRTDQFAVAHQLEGLQEKFQVLNRDELADALRSRLTELDEHRSSWFPEILSLFLQLANRPAQLSRLDRIQKHKPQEDAKSTSWSELDASGSAYCDEDIWENVDFGAESSEEDDFSSVSSDSYHPRMLPETSLAPEEDYTIPEEIFSSVDEGSFVAIRSAQFWRKENHPNLDIPEKPSSRVITELQAVRETVFMLQGLPTSLFWRLDDGVEVDRRYKLSHLSNEVFTSLLRTLSSIGAKINALRNFITTPQAIPHVQTFHRGIEECIHEFDKFLSDVQSRYLLHPSTVAVSLMQLSEDTRRESRLLILLADFVSKLNQSEPDYALRCLDLLYDLVCMTQATGDDAEFRFLAELFFSCFKTYARPFRLWMETGQLEDSIGGTLFVLDNRNDGDLRTLWHDWYTLDETLRLSMAPKFIRPFARKIFITGKSMVFLRHLNVSQDQESQEKQSLAFRDVFPQESPSICLPFSALLESAFGRIVDANHSLTSDLLRKELDEQCGLWISLQALEHIYLCKDMSVSAPIDNKIFDLLDRGRGAWNDRFLLTELAQSAFSTLPFVDPSRLIVRSSKETHHKFNGRNRSVKILQAISFDYILPWPVANIITKDAILSYRRISTFLMQVRRAKYMIVKQHLQHFKRPENISDDSSNVLAYALRHNMLWFLNTLYSHMTDFVITTTTDTLRNNLHNSSDVDAMIAAYRSYMSSLEDQCLLSKNLYPLHQATITLLDLCVSFADLQNMRHGGTRPDQTHRSRKDTHDKYQSDEDDEDDEDDDEESDDPDAEETNTNTPLHEPHCIQRLKDIKDQFNRLVTFMAAGLKGVGRVDGQLSWEILAEKLEWRKERVA